MILGDKVERIFREVLVTPGLGLIIWAFATTIAMRTVTVLGGVIGGVAGVERAEFLTNLWGTQTGVLDLGGGSIEGEGG